MIGFLSGSVIFSDGQESIISTASGIGYQVYYQQILAEGSQAELYISHVIKEASEELYGFSSLREKKMFEMFTKVKGVGPKSAFSLVGTLGVDQIIQAISFENKKVLTKVPGIGPKAASQILLDLSGKIQQIKMYSPNYCNAWSGEVVIAEQTSMKFEKRETNLTHDESASAVSMDRILDDAIMACKELGFKDDQVLPLAKKVLQDHGVMRAEQLVHLVLKEI
jgi:Holliday junction DNA helicase RuvA